MGVTLGGHAGGHAHAAHMLPMLCTCHAKPTSKPANQPTSQPANQPASQRTNQPASQPTNQPTNQPGTCRAHAAQAQYKRKHTQRSTPSARAGPLPTRCTTHNLREAFFDAIRCGALPLLASMHTPLPFADEIDYAAFSIRVPEEARVATVVSLLKALPSARLASMLQAALTTPGREAGEKYAYVS